MVQYSTEYVVSIADVSSVIYFVLTPFLGGQQHFLNISFNK